MLLVKYNIKKHERKKSSSIVRFLFTSLCCISTVFGRDWSSDSSFTFFCRSTFSSNAFSSSAFKSDAFFSRSRRETKSTRSSSLNLECKRKKKRGFNLSSFILCSGCQVYKDYFVVCQQSEDETTALSLVITWLDRHSVYFHFLPGILH